MSVAIRYDMFCQMAYQPLPQRKQRILQQIKETESFYIITKENQPWTFRDIFPVFLEELSAKIKAADMHLFDKGYEVQMIDGDALQILVQQQKNISVVRIYDRLPFYQDYPVLSKQQEIPQISLSLNSEQKNLSTETETKNPQTHSAIKSLISMLDAQDRSAISKLPTYSFFEKFPQLLQKLVQVTGVDLQELDSVVGVDGLTAMTMKTPTADVSKDVLQKYLNYFGLGAYLYRYRDYCSELRQELNRHSEICKYKIVPVKVSTQEPFELLEMKRAKDNNGAYLYQLRFKSKDREQICIDISPLGLIVGKKYELEGLTPLSENQEPSNNLSPPEIANHPIKDKKTNLLTDSKEQQKLLDALKQKESDDTDIYLNTRKDYVLRYFKLQNPTGREVQIKEAEKYYSQLAVNDDILDEFFWKICFPQKAQDLLTDNQEYQKRRDNQSKDLVIKEYTAEKLRKEFRLKYGWETYFFFSELKSHPKKTMEQLKYRKTDPQYQKKQTKVSE